MFIKYKKSGFIDIKPISELINEDEVNTDFIGREYDYSKKDFYVLCRSGWVEPNYIYRHNTNKPIYSVTDGDTTVEVTEDHSLFDKNKNKIKPSEINENTELEYYKDSLDNTNWHNVLSEEYIKIKAIKLAVGDIDRVPYEILNSDKKCEIKVLSSFYRKHKKQSYCLF